MFVMCLQMLTRVFMGSGDLNLIFLKWVEEGWGIFSWVYLNREKLRLNFS